MTATLYLISGQLCSGKTTYSKQLEKETGAVRFSPDEWMLKLYPFSIKEEQFDYYYYLCCDVAWETAKEFLKRKIDVILDFGFWKKADRIKYVQLARNLGVNHKLIFIDCSESIILKRLKKRNSSLPPGTYYISKKTFELFAPGFEQPQSDEIFEVVSTKGLCKNKLKYLTRQRYLDSRRKS